MVFFASCSKEEVKDVTNDSTSSVNCELKESGASPRMRTLWLVYDGLLKKYVFSRCMFPPLNCLPTVVVTASSTEQTALNDFCNAISNGTTNSFFLSESRYSVLFSELSEPENSTLLSTLQTSTLNYYSDYNSTTDEYCIFAVPSNLTQSTCTSSDVVAAFPYELGN